MRAAPRRVTILGSTGSVGCNTLDLIERKPEAFAVEALTANGSAARLAEQAKRVRAKLAVVADESRYRELKDALSGTGIETAAGEQAVIDAAGRPADWVMAAIVGAAGLAPTLAAVRRGVIVALANKETLVCAGSLMTAEVVRHGATLLPVDSEHNAIFQVLDFDRLEAVDRIILTASGGPFHAMTRAAMAEVTPEQAIAHPNWDMGAKISVDSATMMNKGLELIEAHHLFGLPDARIEILVHPQSVVHSMVAYSDGSVLAQMGQPDMRTPIAFTLAWPERMTAPVARLDLAEVGQLTFEAPDSVRFPALHLARQALQTGDAAPTVLNAANEVSVRGFLDGRLGFLDIAAVVERTLEKMSITPLNGLEDVWQMDTEARRIAAGLFDQSL
jgi:1-deoxy-D-xylulose-5-phosphate reductoisomerase